MAAAVNAVGTLTFAGNAVAAETVVVGGVTYTWRAAVTTTANEVLVGASAAASAQNLYDAINATAAQSGVTFGSLTVVNPQVRASAVTATTVVVQAKLPGSVGNLIASTETMTNGSWGGAVLASGSGDLCADILAFVAKAQLNSDVAQQIAEWTHDPAAA